MTLVKTNLFIISEILFSVSKLAKPSFKFKVFIVVIYTLAQYLTNNGTSERMIGGKKANSEKEGTKKPYYPSKIK